MLFITFQKLLILFPTWLTWQPLGSSECGGVFRAPLGNIIFPSNNYVQKSLALRLKIQSQEKFLLSLDHNFIPLLCLLWTQGKILRANLGQNSSSLSWLRCMKVKIWCQKKKIKKETTLKLFADLFAIMYKENPK